MALCTSKAMVIWMQLLLIVMAGAVGADHDACPTGLVYPYWSTCWNPATYNYEGGVYELAGSKDRGLGLALAPEWDEANSTYYVRLAADDGAAKYAFTYLTKELRVAVALSHDVIIQNVDTGRSLGWRKEGKDEYFLIEGDTDQAARFQFSIAEDVSLPCPLILGSRCEAYFILNYSTSLGLSAYEEDGATYFKLAKKNLFPFVLLRMGITSSSPAVGSIKMATDATT